MIVLETVAQVLGYCVMACALWLAYLLAADELGKKVRNKKADRALRRLLREEREKDL